jgi:hypothetical protein
VYLAYAAPDHTRRLVHAPSAPPEDIVQMGRMYLIVQPANTRQVKDRALVSHAPQESLGSKPRLARQVHILPHVQLRPQLPAAPPVALTIPQRLLLATANLATQGLFVLMASHTRIA